MKYIVLCEGKLFLEPRIFDSNILDFITNIAELKEDVNGPIVCTTMDGEKVQVVIRNVIAQSWKEWNPGTPTTVEAFWAIRSYFIQARLVQLAQSNPPGSTNQQAIFKILGFLMPVFLKDSPC